ncbi:MAG: AAA family ATPase, partial [Atopobiaceae bacterium]|nr:AAA family ATPase [Atopobiaceae bacterium]
MQTDEGYSVVSARYRELVDDKRVGFTTFHQSYGYEEFIEGMRPEYSQERNTMDYPVKPGVFRKFCEKAEGVVEAAAASGDFPRYADNPSPRVWKMGLTTNGISNLIDLCREEGCIRLGWDEFAPEDVEDSSVLSSMNKRAILAFQNEMQPGDFVVIPGVSADEYGVAVVTGEFYWKPELGDAMRYRSAKWLKNIDRATFIEMNGGKRLTLQTVYELDRVTAAQLVEALGLVSEPERRRQERKNYVFIIDEINRGNVSKVFGELITLLEDSKRKGAKEELIVELPYSGDSFGVPSNVYVIGTMNTADRSIALMDTALRRRFSFVEVMPDESLFESLEVEGVDIKNMLEVMNRRIELLYDREHTLGHAYLMPLRETPTVKCLQSIFQNKLSPLLQEYFFDDYAKIGAVLGVAAGDFIEKMPADNVFWSGSEVNYDVQPSYRMKGAPDNAES